MYLKESSLNAIYSYQNYIQVCQSNPDHKYQISPKYKKYLEYIYRDIPYNLILTKQEVDL